MNNSKYSRHLYLWFGNITKWELINSYFWGIKLHLIGATKGENEESEWWIDTWGGGSQVHNHQPSRSLIVVRGDEWVGDDSSIIGVIEVGDIDETPTLMSFSQLIHWFICKWLSKGYWLWLTSACTRHANVALSDTSTLDTRADI